MIRIGLTACFFHPDFDRNLFKGKRLLYMEQSMSNYCMRNGSLPLLLPESHASISVEDIVNSVDGLLLQGGSDIAPSSYQEDFLDQEKWPGDSHRDIYEINLFNEALRQKKPVLGICRGHQLINVALGGSLYQDTSTQNKSAIEHRDAELYDGLNHLIQIEEKSHLADLYKHIKEARVNSIHHQAIARLGRNLLVEAFSTQDNIIEAIRYDGDSYVYGVQWHPEFHIPGDSFLLDPDPLFLDFLQAVKTRSLNDS